MIAEVLRGDCLPILRGMATDSVDLIATDPPYGIAFMGKTWDKALPDPAIWRECLRVLKPGASAVVMSGSRLDCLWRMCRDIEAAGFELSQTALYWCYRSGFPKGSDLAKSADRDAGEERTEGAREWRGGQRTGGILGEESGGCGRNLGTQTLVKFDTPVSPLAVALDGWFTKGKVKPAVEVIIWARKPISEKTEFANMAKWGVGGVNCGACMVPFENDEDAGVTEAIFNRVRGKHRGRGEGGIYGIGQDEDMVNTASANPAGRYPANLLCMDSALGEGGRYFDIDLWSREHGFTEDGWAEAAEAGLLQVPKPSRAEKNAGCEGLPEHRAGGMEARNRDSGRGQFDGEQQYAHNPHPTCKPVRLFAYLAEFLCPAGGTVSDPFTGSGTTGVACVQTGRSFIGCELSDEYADIAEARIAHAQTQATPAQLSIALEAVA